jgi:hypothetical protein
MKTIEPFAASPNDFVAIHKVCFDFIMPIVSDSAWKVLCFIIRKTRGFQKVADDIAYKQIAAGTGIRSSTTIRRALMELQGFVPTRSGNKITGWRKEPKMPVLIVAIKNRDKVKGDMPTTFRLNRGFTIEISPSHTSQKGFPPSPFSVDPPSPEIIDTIDKAINKEITLSSNVSKREKSISFSSIVSDFQTFDEPDEETINWLRQQS